MTVEITERGYPAHFCAASNCRFRRNTLLTYGEVRIVVSSVGNYLPNGYEEVQHIGYERYYETMAFHAVYDAPYFEANIQKSVQFKSAWAVQKFDRMSDFIADAMHDNVVNEIKERMLANEWK